jgi:hypothetical protein
MTIHSFDSAIRVRRGEDMPAPAMWTLTGKKFQQGAYSVGIYRGSHPDEPALASFDIEPEPTKAGARVEFALTAEDIAVAQGPRRPELEFLEYRLLHDGDVLSAGYFIIFPSSAKIEGQRKVAA